MKSTQKMYMANTLGVCNGGNENFMFRVGGKGNFSIFRYQHVGISNAEMWLWGSQPTQGPDTNGFALQWNIGFIFLFFESCYLRIVISPNK